MLLLLRASTAFLVASTLALALAGCAKEDGSRILGKWRAERLEVMSLKLPLGPELDITRSAVAMGNGISIPIAGITQDGDEVTLETNALIGLSFQFVEADRMLIELPVVGEIYYRRVSVQPEAASVQDAKGIAEASPAAEAQPLAPPMPTAVDSLPEPRKPAGGGDHLHEIEKALSLVKQGNHDGALRSMHTAFKHGFRDTALLERTPAFDALRADVRYQALVARYASTK